MVMSDLVLYWHRSCDTAQLGLSVCSGGRLLRKIRCLAAVICFSFAFSSYGSAKEDFPQIVMKASPDVAYPWAVTEPQLLVRLDAERGYHGRDKQGPARNGNWVARQVGTGERSLEKAFGLRIDQSIYDVPRGEGILIYLPGPYSVMYFTSWHLGHPTTAGIEVPGKLNLEAINKIGAAEFADIWENLDRVKTVKVDDLENHLPQKKSAVDCDKLLTSCSVDDLICELGRRGWNVNLTPK